ncbi:MAG: hypothetical protein FJZ43_02820 [Candidatus Staskawiczbacteria bacterium]|nr:hypothetical protein [Candidatus Staskawiczbacteria bacterium]
MKSWFYWLTDIAFGGPPRVSQFALFIEAENREVAIRLLQEKENGLEGEVHYLSKITNCSFGHANEQEARSAANQEYWRHENARQEEIIMSPPIRVPA